MNKIYTSIEQSKKLAEFLPLESADMFHAVDAEIVVTTPYITYLNGERNIPGYKGAIPCWSLVALLGVIPKPDLVQNSEGTWLLHSWVNDYPWSVGGYSNPIDAAFEMILKLHELNLL